MIDIDVLKVLVFNIYWLFEFFLKLKLKMLDVSISNL